LFIEYHWVIGQLSNLHDVARSKLEEMLADLGRRLELAGFSQRHVYYTQLHIAPDLGDRTLAEEATKGLRKHPRDALSANPFWELAKEVETELFLGRDERALQLAVPFLEGRRPQHNQSDEVCAHLLLPLFKRGQVDRAAALKKRCRRGYHPEHYYYWWFGELMKFSALHDDLAAVVRSYAECQRAQHRFTDPLTRLHFALDAGIALERILAAGKPELAVRLPDIVPVSRSNGRYAVAELRDWLAREAAELADLFDARNGTSYFHEQIAQRAELCRCFPKNPC
jgi:hypothetical protein